MEPGDLVVAIIDTLDVNDTDPYKYQFASPCNLQGTHRFTSIPLYNGTVGVWLKKIYPHEDLVMFSRGLQLVSSGGVMKVR